MNRVISAFKRFPKTFWTANTMELFERWSWYGFYMLFANYLTKSTDLGALGFSQEEKGLIMSLGTAILYLLPIITGAIADKYGYKKILITSFIIYAIGFLIMPQLNSFWPVFACFFFLAIGGALFKPVISATVAKTTDDDNASIGFGIFYMMVNIGAFIGPIVALQMSKTSFDNVFYLSAFFILINFPLLFFYKEPERKKSEQKLLQSIGTILNNILIALKDFKFIVLLIIIAGFWSMYYQLFYTLPVFIDQWVDTSSLFHFVNNFWPWLADRIGSPDGTIKAEYITNMDALYIIMFQIIVSTIIMKWRPLNAMMTGFLLSSIGMGLTLYTNNVGFIIAAILIFGIGEMAGSPKITEYIGRSAPKDKVALYIGCSYLPVAGGNILAGIISGFVYGKMADKVTLLKLEFEKRGIQVPEITKDFTQTDFYNYAEQSFGLTSAELTEFMWNNYHPNKIWLVLFVIGLISAVGLFIYDRFLIRKSEA